VLNDLDAGNMLEDRRRKAEITSSGGHRQVITRVDRKSKIWPTGVKLRSHPHHGGREIDSDDVAKSLGQGTTQAADPTSNVYGRAQPWIQVDLVQPWVNALRNQSFP
jgi:hypothetical protein